MARRYPVRVLLCPRTIYQHAARIGEGYAPAESARFAVIRERKEQTAPWILVHRRTGAPVESLLPALPRKLTMTDKLNVASAFEAATHLDWSSLDDLPETTPETTRMPVFADQAAARHLNAALRDIACAALGVAA